MIPALKLLQTRGGELGVTQPWQFFWAAGGLSSFLDNAPTYLTFMTLALGRLGIDPGQIGPVLTGALPLPEAATFAAYLKAVSVGAVLMGANTYIGNAPNFMVLSIAKEHGVKMPSFFGYMLWSGGILIPVFIIATFIFF
jgi:Na+/H+ antiporter NhaD/arsenite permease-like protein